MSSDSNLREEVLSRVIARYHAGDMPRREFLRTAMATGVAAGTAAALAGMWGGQAFAQSTLTADPPASPFDYVVVGAGSAGAVVAARLAELTSASILVLEAGGADDLPEIHDPRLWPKTLDTRAAKTFRTTPQVHTANRVHDWPRGNVLGGTSCLNATVFVRGHRSDFDAWAYDGCVGWDYASVLPLFKALEDYVDGASDYRGAGGPLHVTYPKGEHQHPGAVAFIEACTKLGLVPTDDYNAERMEGAAWNDLVIKDSRRQSTAVAFLKPALGRPNLTVLTDAPVLRLIIESGRCTGVEYLHGGRPRRVTAGREVILSAGAVDSPRLLMLSGIGPAEDLRRLGIPVVADLPGVGRNLQDHLLGAGVNYEAREPVPVSAYNHSEVQAFWRSDARLLGPDIVMLYISVPFTTPAFDLKIEHGYSMLSGVVRPCSRGTIRLASADPAVPPLIDPNYLAEEQDWQAFVRATEIARELGGHKVYADVRAREVLPGPEVRDRAGMRAFLAKACNTYFHPTSTCKMGVDALAVVDPALRVYGVEGLRVADASVMPTITSGNTNAPTIMIGWKCADMIAAAA